MTGGGGDLPLEFRDLAFDGSFLFLRVGAHKRIQGSLCHMLN